MFFRRMFSRKDDNYNMSTPPNKSFIVRHEENNAIMPFKSPKRSQRTVSSASDNKRSLSVLQLTPLWEHIIRTRTLPENINPIEMFEEFLERLKDPEWQVRQHALRVLIDVLAVIGSKSDLYFGPLIPQLVENLGHSAPTVRKGALDCLKIYIVETSQPEKILLEILDIGLNQRITNEPFGGRLTCGVMLSLPALVQATLHTPKRNYILRSTIDMLINRMNQVTNQEITLKVLLKLKELIGPREFSDYMSPNTYREFETLCNVYGIGEKNLTNANRSSSWQQGTSSYNNMSVNPLTLEYYRHYDEFYLPSENFKSPYHGNTMSGKLIMETDIQINNDTSLKMRILQGNNGNEISSGYNDDDADNSSDDDMNGSDDVVLENSGIIEVLTDSELEEINRDVEINDEYVRRTPKRVTFGGEIVKMRTPDSDTVTQSDNDDKIMIMKNVPTTTNHSEENFSFLTVEIPNDNTKPLPSTSNAQRPKSATTSKSPMNTSPISSNISASSPKKKISPSSTEESNSQKSISPRSPFRRINISPVDTILNTRTSHKEVEVLHNLQRSPCPSPRRRLSLQQQSSEENPSTMDAANKANQTNEQNNAIKYEESTKVKSWEDLGLVDESVIRNLKSGDWRLRSHAICEIEESLKSSENLALIQPYLDSLLRTLLSSEKNADIAEDKRRIIMNLISRLPLDNLENRAGQIITGLCRQGGAGSNRISKSLMQRLPPAVIVLKLLSDDFLHAKSSKFRENALQMVMYALMTFPSTLFDTTTCVTRATYAALDRKKRVRQAALDVLAVLGQVTSPRTVIEIVQKIANNREDGDNLCRAVKARLARKQLPIISPEGSVQSILKIPSPQNSDNEKLPHLSADIEWIANGIGSVSPSSMKRRTQIIQPSSNFMNGKFYNDSNRENFDEIRHHHHHKVNEGYDLNFKSNDTLNNILTGSSGNLDGTNLQYQHKPTITPIQVSGYKPPNSASGNGDLIGIYGKRIGSKLCSDSSQDGRSSDSTSGSNNTRYSKLPITSRFPAMERLNVNSYCVERQSFRNCCNHQTCHMNDANHPKQCYSIYEQRKEQKSINTDTYTESSCDSSSNSNGSSTSINGERNCLHHNQKRFMNVDKFIMQSRKRKSIGVIQENNPVTTNNDCNNGNNNHCNVNGGHEGGDGDNIRIIPIPPLVEMAPKVNRQQFQQNSNQSQENLRKIRPNEIIENSPPKSVERHESPVLINSEKQPPSRVDGDCHEEIPVTVKTNSNIDLRKLSASENNSHETMNTNTSPVSINNIEELKSNSDRNHNQNVERIFSRPSSEISIMEANSTRTSPESNNSENIDKENKQETIKLHENESIKEIKDEIDKISQCSTKSNHQELQSKETTSETPKSNDVDNHSTNYIENKSPSTPQSIITEQVTHSAASHLSDPITGKNQLTNDPVITTNMTKSYESIFDPSIHRPPDIDRKSTASTETSSDYQTPSVDEQPHTSPGFVEVKPQHAPLMRKSKTAFFNRNRRISPVKQSIKMGTQEPFPMDLKRFDNPRESIHKLLDQLNSSNWQTIMLGLTACVRLIRHHPDMLEAQMHMVCMKMSKSALNLRSQVSRAACQASTELFAVRSKALETECDDLVGSLLHRTADTNRFLRADATKALESMCDNLLPSKILHLLTTRGAVHQNALVRTTTAKLLNRLADRLGCERIYNMTRENRDKFILTGANLLLEGSLETRSYAKSLFRLLAGHHSFTKVILEVIPQKTYRNIEKTIKNLR